MTFKRLHYRQAGRAGADTSRTEPRMDAPTTESPAPPETKPVSAVRAATSAFAAALGFEPRVAVFTDTYVPDRNGVAHSIEREVQIFRRHGIRHLLVGPSTTDVHFPVRAPTVFPTADHRYSLQLPSVTPRLIASRWKANVVHIHTPFSFGLLGLRYAQRVGARVIYTHHTSLDDYLHYVPLLDHPFGRGILRGYMKWFAGRMDSMVVPSAAARGLLSELGVPEHKQTLLPTPLDQIHAAEPRQWPDKRYDLLFVGRLAPEKNPDLLVAVINAVMAVRPEAAVALVGDGIDRRRVLAEIGAFLRPNIHYLGEMDKHRLLEVYRASRLVFSPSLTETQGLVLQEALSQGVPVVALRHGQVAEFLRDGVNGLLLPPDAASIAAAVDHLLRSPDRYAALRAKAFEVRETFSPERWLEGFFSALTDERRGRSGSGDHRS